MLYFFCIYVTHRARAGSLIRIRIRMKLENLPLLDRDRFALGILIQIQQ